MTFNTFERISLRYTWIEVSSSFIFLICSATAFEMPGFFFAAPLASFASFFLPFAPPVALSGASLSSDASS